MKLGVIDIGTNSTRLMICDYENNKIHNVKKYLKTTRLGANSYLTGILDKDRMSDTVEAIEEYVAIAKEKFCEKIYIFATSAVRNAKNSSDFKKLVKERTGIDIDIVNGDIEARLGFRGAVRSINFYDNMQNYKNDKPKKSQNNVILMIDIGGGSTELTLGYKNGEIIQTNSLEIGVVRLTDKYDLNFDDNLNCSEWDKYNQKLTRLLEDVQGALKLAYGDNIPDVDAVVGVAGTITSILQMRDKIAIYNPLQIHNKKLGKYEIILIMDNIKYMSLEEKKQIIGLDPKRADVILAGVFILIGVMNYLKLEALYVSDSDNLEGYVYERLS